VLARPAALAVAVATCAQADMTEGSVMVVVECWCLVVVVSWLCLGIYHNLASYDESRDSVGCDGSSQPPPVSGVTRFNRPS
jgi:hypothetical protein